MSHWIDNLAGVQSRQQPAISVAVASTKGSVPREAGTRMLVTPTEVLGTIGGGHLEFKAIQIARDMLAAGGKGALMRFPLGASLGQCCGGLMNLLFEPVLPCDEWVAAVRDFQQKGKSIIVVTCVRGCGTSGKLLVAADELVGSLGGETLDREITAIARQRLAGYPSSTLLTVAGDAYFFEAIAAPDFNIVLFGAGHVGRAVVKILAELPCKITWIDCREAEFPAEVPRGVDMRLSDFPEDEVAFAAAGSYFLVMTHSHQLDQVICERIFARQDFAYFGLIGSLSKRRQFERRFAARGIPAVRFADMNCPIGAGGIASKEPMAIAVSVAAELLQRREALQQMCKGGMSDFHLLPPSNERESGSLLK
ncbi:MAG: xanthine dehydrogenase accessory protein XdhC [Betaproteobacteria bacterium]|nr:xanthine dehydrogenase accessory protein XdhC [Betaproteobacteria bacterium]